MTDRPLTPADHADLVLSLAYALRYNQQGKRAHERDELAAQAAAEHLAEALRLSGFVVMKGPGAPAHTADTAFRSNGPRD